MDRDTRIAVVGLGYVGLPLAVALARKYDVTGFDISARRVADLLGGVDSTREVDSEQLAADGLNFTAEPAGMRGCSIFIVTVPTPIDEARRPDFRAILSACELVGPVLERGAVVVFESTVYPGVTEDICGPALEASSGLRCGTDFTLGYSPERINPGDKARPIEKIVKVVAGQDPATLDRLAEIYGSVIEAGIHRAGSIRVAEAAKVIENTQRDVNIALMNEISKICDLAGIRTSEVLEAAGTKWNFLPFHPGLVGGHCIGVDPYYLTAKAEQLGYHPQVILSGRRINDGMGAYVAQRLVKLLAKRDQPVSQARVAILGFTFKENVPDIRNSKVVDIYEELRAFGIQPLVHDPVADVEGVKAAYGVELCDLDRLTGLAAVVLAVSHREFAALDGAALGGMLDEGGIVVDVRSQVDPASLRSDISYWSL
ncbi:nucleotide sugar dehydrogenase [Sphingomonas sabuli]|uniref:Nucleotide sugar dehydrogenase n=1 Tax=Sphingomonas sabuli TaxID=2764186 RepID=A0A7G9L5C1_9SPHN|nr:nucleotide sugar dehydrogenase [Sphingomonas sabuli]QNM83820.1 nucleotide sugar dehydrogenase [Sphingomonas sabuli]